VSRWRDRLKVFVLLPAVVVAVGVLAYFTFRTTLQVDNLRQQSVLESTLALRTFEVDQKTQGDLPMIYAPQSQRGNFFNRQERNVRSLQFVEALTMSRDWHGQHVFKFGFDFQRSHFDGINFSHDVNSVRLDGSLAERITFSPPSTNPEVTGTEVALFAQDRWRVNDHFDVSPDLQWIWRAGGNAAAPTIFVGGVRARVGF